jgi:hypothetical protein
VWEVLGHLEILTAAGLASELVDDDARPRFALFQPDARRIHAAAC